MADRSYEAVVVGAGNGGLAAAAQLAAKGVKVLLLEQHNVPGGFATSFVRGRFEFEGAMHLIADMGPPENRGSVREFLEDDLGVHLQWFEIPEAYRLIQTDPAHAMNVKIHYGVDRFVNDIASAVPGSREAVARYIAEEIGHHECCLLYTSDAAADLPCVDLGRTRIIKNNNH